MICGAEQENDDRIVQMLRTSHPCPLCGRESTYFWRDPGGEHQACAQHTPRYVMNRRAA